MPQRYSINFNISQLESKHDSTNVRVPSQLRGMLKNDSVNYEKSFGMESQPSGSELAKRRNVLNQWNEEHTARFFLQSILEGQDNEQLNELTSPSSPMLVPDMRMKESRGEPLMRTHFVSFEQTAYSIPVFGTNAIIELDSMDKKLVALDASLMSKPDIDPIAKLTTQDALKSLVKFCNSSLAKVKPGINSFLEYYQKDENDSWHLVYHIKEIELDPPVKKIDLPDHINIENFRGCMHESSPRESSKEYDYLVDANSGEVLYWYSSAPRFQIPTPCQGVDEKGNNRSFHAQGISNGFEMHDPQRNISTYDMNFAPLSLASVPSRPVDHSNSNFGTNFKAAVSAHSNAIHVYDFFNNLLKRHGLDGKGMRLKSVVNTVESHGTREWPNAAWWKNHMWYGQARDSRGRLKSFAEHLDVIGHELAHGVTETTSGLIYAHLSGALNESFSDTFGILIKNWNPATGFFPISSWSWEMGSGIGKGGGPIRDFSNPSRTGQPDHFNQYIPLPNDRWNDYGGVHIYSGIHNKAVHGVLTSIGTNGSPIISATEVSIIYYLTLLRLTARADFSDCRRTLLNVAATYYSYDLNVQLTRLNVIKNAYQSVGII